MRKKRTQREPLKGDISLLEWAEGLTFWVLEGKMVGRLSHRGPPCEYCGTKERKLHTIGCKLELSPCGLHETCWECSCEYHKEDL